MTSFGAGPAGGLGRATRLLLGILLVGGLSADARAELFRCEDADGRITYTDNPAACPGSRPHEPRGVVQKVLGGSTASPRRPGASASPSAPAAPVEATAEQTWRQRKQDKEAELAQLESKQEHLREMVIWCNHGGEVVHRDEIGTPSTVPCGDLRSEFDSLEARIAAVRHYLDEEIQEECRRSGCLPGWIR
jgi:hypothetical protein